MKKTIHGEPGAGSQRSRRHFIENGLKATVVSGIVGIGLLPGCGNKEEEGKPILAHGGAEFMQNLIETGLIDEFHLVIHPVALGTGLPIFSGLSKRLYLKLVDTQVFPGGTVAHTYHPA